MSILSELCSLPTAPFAEQEVIRYVERLVAERPRLRLTRDMFNNLLIELPGRRRSQRLIFVAHMDHPGFVARRMIGARKLQCRFHGYVLREYLKGAKVRFFENFREVGGTVISTTPSADRSGCADEAVVRVDSPVSPGAPGMFDLVRAKEVGDKFHSRACDDLAGAAACLTMLDQLMSTPPHSTIGVLLTRGEEDGFVGALGAVLESKLLKQSDRVISVECSAMQPYARQGDGVVLRVGDRTSIFNSSLMYFLNEQAQFLAKRDKTFKFQRSLMPGGTCEATVFDAYGFLTGAICVPLGNYHNMDREKTRLGAEYVDLNDWNNMVKLFVEVAKRAHELRTDMAPLKQKLEKRFKQQRDLLRPT